jgi:predicted N-acetyltransferase YhbS
MITDYRVARSSVGVDFAQVAALLEQVNLANFDAATHQKAFEGSAVVVYVYDGNELIGCGRALSDGAYEAALYDVAVRPELQGQGLGRLIVETILQDLEGQNVIFYAAAGKEEFYAKMGCLHMSTGMAHWRNPTRMIERGYSDCCSSQR